MARRPGEQGRAGQGRSGQVRSAKHPRHNFAKAGTTIQQHNSSNMQPDKSYLKNNGDLTLSFPWKTRYPNSDMQGFYRYICSSKSCQIHLVSPSQEHPVSHTHLIAPFPILSSDHPRANLHESRHLRPGHLVLGRPPSLHVLLQHGGRRDGLVGGAAAGVRPQETQQGLGGGQETRVQEEGGDVRAVVYGESDEQREKKSVEGSTQCGSIMSGTVSGQGCSTSWQNMRS